MNNKGIEEYKQLRNQIDTRIEELTSEHKQHLTCSKGCDLCCFSFRIFPVEFYAIAGEMNVSVNPDISVEIGETERCGLLDNHQCSIYNSRPIICRTHGMPLLNTDENGDEWQLNICELNFKDADDDLFNDDNILFEDQINAELFQINKQFIEANPQLKLTETNLIPVKELIKNR